MNPGGDKQCDAVVTGGEVLYLGKGIKVAALGKRKKQQTNKMHCKGLGFERISILLIGKESI